MPVGGVTGRSFLLTDRVCGDVLKSGAGATGLSCVSTGWACQPQPQARCVPRLEMGLSPREPDQNAFAV